MKQRPEPLAVPTRSIYFTVDNVWFRSPSPSKGMRALSGLGGSKASILLGAASEATDPAVLMGLVSSVGPDMINILGYFIGVAWYDLERELEAEWHDNAMVYGERVIEELHDEEWSLSDMVGTAAIVMKHWTDQQALDRQAMARAANFQKTDATTSSSTSGSTTSETPGASPS